MQNKRKQIIVLDTLEDVFGKYKKYPNPVKLLHEDKDFLFVEDKGMELKIKRKEIKAIHIVGTEKTKKKTV